MLSETQSQLACKVATIKAALWLVPGRAVICDCLLRCASTVVHECSPNRLPHQAFSTVFGHCDCVDLGGGLLYAQSARTGTQPRTGIFLAENDSTARSYLWHRLASHSPCNKVCAVIKTSSCRIECLLYAVSLAEHRNKISSSARRKIQNFFYC